MEILLFALFSALCLMHIIGQFSMAMLIKKHQPEQQNLFPKISIVIAAHNEIQNLKTLIPILLDQEYPEYEIVIALDRCTDESGEFLGSFQSSKLRFISIQTLESGIHPKKNAITKAIEAANGEWILLTDADCIPSKSWVREMSQSMTKEIVVGLSPYEQRGSFLNQFIQYETFQTAIHFVSSAANKKPYMALGRNLAYRKSLFKEVDGFGASKDVTGGDDDLLIQRMLKKDNYELALTSNSSVDSIPEKTWASYIRQKTRHLSVGKHYPRWVQKRETLRWLVHSGMWLLFVPVCTLNPLLALLILTFTLTMKAISINIVASKLEKRFNHLWLPFVDLIYAVFLPLIGLRSLLVKNIKWN